MIRTLSIALCCGFVVSLFCPNAKAVTVASSNFSIGFGANVNTANSNPGAWSTTETNAANTPVTAGNANATSLAISPNFTLTPTVLGRNFSGTGPSFPGRVLTNAADVSAWSNTFDVTLTGAYIGSLPSWATNVRTTVNISQMSIYAAAYNAGALITDVNTFHFNESTLGNMASSPNALPLVSVGAITGIASNYHQLTWNPSELAVLGLSATRNFNVSGFGNNTVAYMLDGYQIFGSIEVSYDFPAPEPSSLSLLGLGLIGLLRRRPARCAAASETFISAVTQH